MTTTTSPAPPPRWLGSELLTPYEIGEAKGQGRPVAAEFRVIHGRHGRILSVPLSADELLDLASKALTAARLLLAEEGR